MKTWKPWTIENGTLQLQEWPDHPPGNVLVEVDAVMIRVGREHSGRTLDGREWPGREG